MNVNERYTWRSVCDGYSDVGLRDGISTGDAICQLADYENTGLSPSEIANVVPVVKCKDCKFYGNGDCSIQTVRSMYPNDYCSYGEKSDNNMENKIKAIDPKIIVKGTADKPYYSIEYYDTADNKWHIGYGSYNLENVIEWLKTDFEIVEADVVPLYHSKWIPKSSDGNDYLDPRCKCSHCGSLETPLIKHKYCPSCGAKTDLRELERNK